MLLTNTVVASTAGGERGAVPAEPGRSSGQGEGRHCQRVSTTTPLSWQHVTLTRRVVKVLSENVYIYILQQRSC